MFYFRSEINSQLVKQMVNKLFSNRFRLIRGKHKMEQERQMSTGEGENKLNLERKPELRLDSLKDLEKKPNYQVCGSEHEKKYFSDDKDKDKERDLGAGTQHD